MRRFMGDALRDEPAMLSELKEMHEIAWYRGGFYLEYLQ
jgi:hypothetical protein